MNSIASTFINVHRDVRYTLQKETNNEIAFLDLLLNRSIGGPVQLLVHRKATWDDQYIRFDSFVSIRMAVARRIRCGVRT